jgi:hypothetical protein
MFNTNICLFLASIFFISTTFVDGAEKNDSLAPTVRFCYECTSILHPGCADEFEGDTKFPHEKVLKYNYSRSCSDSDLLPYHEPGKTPRAVGCRKILQEVDGKTRIVRQCAYTKPDDTDEVSGLKRTGNQGVRLFYYQCARDYCNSATKTTTTAIFSIILTVIFAFVVRL